MLNRSNCLILIAVFIITACSDGGGGTPDAGTPGTDGTVAGPDGSGPGPDGSVGPNEPQPVQCANAELKVGTASERCLITNAGEAGYLLLRGAVLAADATYDNGQVLISSGKIVCVGCDCSSHADYAKAAVYECAKGVISPGLINSHDHLGFTTAHPVPNDYKYDHRHEWRKGKNGKPKVPQISNQAEGKDDGERWGELRMIIGGATSIMGYQDVDKLLRNLDGDDEGLASESAYYATFPLGDSSGQLYDEQCNYPKLPNESSGTKTGYVPHVAEGINAEARNEYLCLSGQQADSVDIVNAKTSFIHFIGVTATDMRQAAEAGAGLIWSARSNIGLYGMTANVVQAHNLGMRIAIGNDWTTSGSMNLLRELACVDSLNKNYYDNFFSDYQLWQMVTQNGADAADAGHLIGKIADGYYADIVIFDGSSRSSYGAVIRADIEDVVLSMRGGELLYGDDALISETGCETVDVCGRDRKLCLEREVGKNLAALKTSVGDAYDLFFCGTPKDEPSCLPSRPNEYDGSSTATDSDGDGIADSEDKCPKVFSPLRPVDDNKQMDTDNDGIGDVCDPCPFDADHTKCASGLDPNDKDGDGIANDADNCPTTANADQLDKDEDGVGDACDTCDKPNPGGSACPYPVKELRDPSLNKRPADGSKVSLSEVVVTAISVSKPNNFSFFVREGTNAFEAIQVFTKSDTPADQLGTLLKVGDIVSLDGELISYSDIDEIGTPTNIVVSGSGDATPVDITPEKLQAKSSTGEELESHLVRVSTVVVASMFDATGVKDEFWVTTAGGSCDGENPACTQVSDFIYDGDQNDGKPEATVGKTYSSIVGIVSGFGSYYSLQPRSDADLVTP